MFGIVPKALWGNVTDVDAENRILLATRSLLIVHRGQQRVILVDTGCGTKWTPEKAARFAIETDADAIPKALSSAGFTEGDVTDVVISHLHFDHNGGLTRWVDKPGGRTELHFPHAKHWVHRRHWDHAREPHIKDRASFLPEDFVALEDAGVLEMVDGDTPGPPFEGLKWLVTHGHTPYQLHPIIGGKGDSRLLFVGDIVPTASHLRLGWVMAYDMQPMQTIAEKKMIYRQCLEDGLWLAFPHDPSTGGVVLDGSISRPIVSRALEI
ncbi:MAG: MBL fold metallo-hydrolase [Planctomycetes bacterium]|nr:MBL fold metallo-hydrolase [Planctomycetota bacterium]